MRSLGPNVVVVDDQKEEIDGIIDYYHNLGIGCKYYNADYSDGDEPPKNTMPDVLLLFLDLYYNNDSSANFDPYMPAGWVNNIIPQGAFYILVLWTKDPSQADSIISILNKNNLSPYQVITENKSDYVIDGAEKYDYSKLFDSIRKTIEDNPAIEEVLVWKDNIKRTSNVVLGGLVCGDPNEFSNKLRKVIVSHGGETIASSKDPNSKRSTLFEALNNVLMSNVPQYDSENPIAQINIDNLYNTEVIPNIPVDSQLNSWFHFTLRKDLEGKTYPGVIAKNNSPFLQKFYSIKDDDRIKEFISFQLDSEKTVIEDIILNITRPCDYAQNKYGKNLKLLSGIMIKNPERKNNEKQDIKIKKPQYDSIIVFDHLFHDNQESDLTLIFDLRYCFSLPECIISGRIQNFKMLNKQLLSEIQVNYSSYTSRLGFTKIY